jgi:hypothetical protein
MTPSGKISERPSTKKHKWKLESAAWFSRPSSRWLVLPTIYVLMTDEVTTFIAVVEAGADFICRKGLLVNPVR